MSKPLTSLGAAFAAMAVAGGLMALPSPVQAQSVASATSERRLPSRLTVPPGVSLEGIATSADGTVAYVGSRADGTIYELDIATDRARRLSAPTGSPALGMKVDELGRLWVAGGSGGDVRVIDTESGRTLARYQLVPQGDPAFINDVVLTKRAAYFTNSSSAAVYKIPLVDRRSGEGLPGTGAVRVKPLTGAWTQVASAINANGITSTPDDRALLVINSTTGQLLRVRRDGTSSVVDTRGYSLAAGDGMLLEGRTLYVVRNVLNTVAVLKVTRSGRIAKLKRTFSNPGFDTPTTIARAGGRLYLPNAQFMTPVTATTVAEVVSFED